MNQTASAPPLLAQGRVIGGCRILHEVKRGGMGCVYQAEHLALRCPVAFKTILPFQDDHQARRMFLREAQLCAQVDHPNVVVTLNAGEEGGIPYIVMRYVEGKNLSEYLQDQGGPLPWQTVLRVMRLAVRGLAAVHGKGLVHRDIKPSNIMVSFEGRVLLMDFGLVREASESTLGSASGVMGTPQFMSPEQCEGRALDRRSDIFSVGSTLYYLLTAALPFGKGGTEAILSRILSHTAPPPVCQVNPAVPREVSDLVARAMAFDVRRRFASADELYRAMREILVSLAPATPTPPSAVPAGEGTLSLGGLAPELAPLELVPQDVTEITPSRAHTIWFVLGGAALAAAASLLLALNSSPAPIPEDAPSLANMVAIEAGGARLGISIDRCNAYLQTLLEKYEPLGNLDGKFLDQRDLTVPVPKFWIDKYEVTNAEYLRFIQATHHPAPEGWTGGHPGLEALERPVTNITYADAEAYARWAKKKLPTVAQWMRAFHGEADTLFPWGNEFVPDRANTKENLRDKKALWRVSETPTDVSPFGVYNLVGNASEMTRDPAIHNGVTYVVVKGGSGNEAGRIWGVGASQDFKKPDQRAPQVGFRCVYEPPDPADR